MPDDGEDVSTPPAAWPGPTGPSQPWVPQQRAPYPGEYLPPAPVELYQMPPVVLVPGAQPLPLPPAPRRRRRGLLIAGLLALVAALVTAGGVLFVAGQQPLPTLAEAAPPRKLTPLEGASASLDEQAEALLAGDEQAWLAAVDPEQEKLRARYGAMFRSLRSLGVARFDYDLVTDNTGDDTATRITARARIYYCLRDNACDDPDVGPMTVHKVRLEPVGGRWVLTSSSTERTDDTFQPAPWDAGGLVFSQGERVTLAALPGQKKHFAEVQPIAEAAAKVNDRFAALVGNPQQRYRIYLAGTKEWKSWFGGIDDKWVVGYAVPLGESGMDVVLNMDELRRHRRLLETTVQHELAHVVTIGTLHRKEWGQGDMWLKEGIAEYIGWYPQPATSSWRRTSVREIVRGDDAPTTIAAGAMSSDAREEEGDAFYGFGHFAADCLAKKYGQKALFTFVRLYLREEKDLEPASQEAFGRPFSTVDKTCVAWIRDNA